jgi:CheY-like chemotaxis protein/DNA-binding XRE family transcriptional regulator
MSQSRRRIAVLSLRAKPNGTNGDGKPGLTADPGADVPQPTSERNSLYCAGEVRILVMDDDDQVCRLVQEAFAPQGFIIDAVSDPSRMEAQLRDRSYHVIILDYVIPTLASEQLLEWIRESQPEASIIVVTAYPSIDSALNCLRARTYDYLTKPFQIAHLQRIVTRCLESKGLLRLSEQALRESLGNAIRERRKALGLTLAQMAQRTGVSLGYLSQIELGKNSASIETLYRISLGLGVKMADLFQTVQPNL